MNSRNRQFVVSALIAALWLFAGRGVAHAQGWSNGYSYQRAITIFSSQVPNTDQTNFPMLFSGTYSYLATTTNGGGVTNSSGYDIIFTSDSAGTNVLPYERESYNATTGAVLFWVQVPTVSHSSNTVIYLFYGNSSVTTDQSNKNGAWNSNFTGVWHLPNGSTLSPNDSTSNANNGTLHGATATTGVVDGAANFVASSSQYISMADNSTLKPASLTFSFWMNPSGSQQQYAHVVEKGAGASAPWGSFDFQLNDSGSDSTEGSLLVGTTNNVTNSVSFPSGSFSSGTWYFIAGTFNSSTNVLTAYKNGQSVGSVTASVGTIDYDTTGLFFAHQYTYGQYFNGALDEVRISNIARSADWIATEYNNQSSPITFYDEGSPAIFSLSPNSGYFGTSVTISGRHFGSAQGTSTVTFNGVAAPVTSWSDTSIVVTVPVGASSGNVIVTVSGITSNGSTFSIFPTGWSDQDISSPGVSGSASYSADTFTVQGAGNISGTADAFNFTSQALSGDGTIVARILSLSGGASTQSAGVMIRETLTAGSRFYYVNYYPSNAGFGWADRSSTSGSTSGQTTTSGIAPPYWLKIVRSGNTFSGYLSSDGVDWTQTGSTQTISMATNVYVGLAVDSANTTNLATATFDNVSVSQSSSPAPVISSISATTGAVGAEVDISGSNFGSTQGIGVVYLNHAPVTIDSWSNTAIVITIPSGATSGYLVVSIAPSMDSNPVDFTVTSNPLPDGWLDSDVGTVGLAGSASYSSGTFTVNGAGGGINYNQSADAFHFVYQSLSGDGSIVARVVSAQGTAAGVMIRETLDAGATYYFIDYEGSSEFGWAYRGTTGGNAWVQSAVSASLPYWVKVQRVGTTFTGYTSADGVTWTQRGSSETISMATNVYIGLAVTSGSTSSLATATFDNVTASGGEPPATPQITSISPTSGGIGSSVTVDGYYFGGSQGSSQVKFNGVAATSITSWSDSQIVATVPSSATTGPVVVVVSGVGSNNNYTFTVYNPIISSISPSTAPANASVTLTGSGFGTTQSNSVVQFNGVGASISSWSDTSITVSVPAGATSGPVTVTEGGITSNGVQFTALGTLSITSISPSSGPIGMSVTFIGTGFGTTQGNSSVTFNTIPTAVTSWSDTQIVVTVPLAASPGAVTVAVDGVTALGPTFTPLVKAQVTDSLGNSSNYVAAVNGGEWHVSTAQGSGCTTCTVRGNSTYSYDAYGNVTSLMDPNGNTTTYIYDPFNNLASQSSPVDSTHTASTSYTYNSFGEVLTVTDALGNVTTNTYDAHGNLTSVTTPAPQNGTSGSETQFGYNSIGELTTITDPLNNVTTMTYTSAGLIATITDAQSNVTTYGYDARGNRTSVKDANNQTTTYAYDAGNRLTTITYPDTTTTQFGYDYRGRRTSVTDQNGKTTIYGYDDADRLTSVTDAANHTTTYTYDTEDNLTEITDANTHSTFFTYDAFGRVTNANFPSSQGETYAYDANNNLTSKTDRKGQTITYVYDALNRLTSKAYPDTTSIDYVYDLVGKVLSVNDPTGTYAFAYDNMGRLIGTTTSYSFLTSRNFTTSYSYDAASNRTGFTDPEGGTTGYSYDTLNRLTALAPPSAFGSGSFGFGYDALSRRTQMTRPNNVTTNYTYDSLSRLLSVLHQVGSSTIDGAGYSLDNAGNRTSKTDWLANVTSNYTYDQIYELTQVTQGTNTTESYSYDSVGNRLSSLGVASYTVNNSNELTATSTTSYTYDNNGNTLTRTVGSNTTSYAWDYENRLTSVTLPGSGGTVTFKYDPFGRRIEKISPTFTSIFAYDGDNLVETVNSSGGVVSRYAHTQNIDEPLAELGGSATSYYEADGLGSVTSLTTSAGAVGQSYTYDSFGKQTASSGSISNPFQYTSREFDTETGFYFDRARYYDPEVGRFPSEDPARFRGGLNFYAYSLNSPANFNDPFGLAPEGCTDCQGNPVQGVAAGKRCCANADPLANSAPDPYPAGYYYVGVSAQFMFQNGGNGPWGNIVRGCLVCMYSHGSDANSAHFFCYLNGVHRTTFVQGLSGLATAVGEANLFILSNNKTLIPMSTGPMVTR